MQVAYWVSHQVRPPLPQYTNALIGHAVIFRTGIGFVLPTCVGGIPRHALVSRARDDTTRRLTSDRHRIGLLTYLLIVITLAACSAPVTVKHVDLRTAYDDVNRTALSSNQLSETTRTVLRRAALLDTFDEQPDAAIASLRAQEVATGMHWPN
jgi:hypothetical protein